MPIIEMTPIREAFVRKVRTYYENKFNTQCKLTDTRILRSAMFLKIASPTDPNMDILLDDLHEQHATIKPPKSNSGE